jgi:hypothetical protein
LLYKGWIGCKLSERKLLQSFGIKLGEYDYDENIFMDCIVPEAAFAKLDEHFNILSWGLDPWDGDR